MNKPMKNKTQVLSTTLAAFIFFAWHTPLPAQDSLHCELPEQVDKNITLNPQCTYHQTLSINTPNISIDCNGATLDGQQNLKNGLLINSQGKPLKNITITNCRIKNFKSQGILITSGIPDYKKTTDHQINYDNSPSNITIENSQIVDTGGVGVFLNSYVTNATIKNSEILRSKGVGIYLEQSSRNNKILNNTIKDNGEPNGPKAGQREGLAIDSSAQNLIEGNKFISNVAGGIFLYKNCGEQFSKGKSVIRWQHSNDNIIRNNSFTDEKTGIWVASRQSANLQKSDCGDKPLDSEGKYYQDYADHNTIENNVFCRNKTYIRIEGNNNIIENNRSDKTEGTWITEPTTITTRLTGAPTTGNLIKNNTYERCD